MKRVLIHTFGCQMNAHDSQRIEQVLGEAGYATTAEAERADLIVFNTCSVREKAEHKLMSAVGTLRPLKQARPELQIAVAGCVAQQHGPALLQRLKLVDVLVGPDNIRALPGLLGEARDSGRAQAQTVHDLAEPDFLATGPTGPAGGAVVSAAPVSAYVTVMKGCDERCSFCIVPHTRGSERYRPAGAIVDEVRTFVQRGAREVTLLGQTVNSWHEPGEGESSRSDDSRFAELLRRIAEVPDLARLRYTSPHPRHVTPALVAAHAELEVLPAHVHLPVQSGSDRVLKRMIRRYRRADYIERARRLMAAREGLTLSTDLIVGFPGETEEDFAETLSLVREVGFVAAFAFKYSPRPYTPALALGDDVPEEVKGERLSRLFEVVESQQYAHLQTLVGSRTRVLFEGPSKGGDGAHVGRSERHEIVHVRCPPGIDPTGQLLEVEIVEAHRHSVSAELRQQPAPAAARRGGRSLPLVVA
ncbi:MAG: tRNA (N6-isopentenyl adenosine(37)-C2)-methylthiotransferase MiaB [Myxococcales bacterium]|nr:tRNA (N6-isopentenyl adenosine(37)-C2)-methylthiotransferase MiaB [Myxococcales bacterium]